MIAPERKPNVLKNSTQRSGRSGANVTVTKNTRQKKSRTPTFTSAADALFLVPSRSTQQNEQRSKQSTLRSGGARGATGANPAVVTTATSTSSLFDTS